MPCWSEPPEQVVAKLLRRSSASVRGAPHPRVQTYTPVPALRAPSSQPSSLRFSTTCSSGQSRAAIRGRRHFADEVLITAINTLHGEISTSDLLTEPRHQRS